MNHSNIGEALFTKTQQRVLALLYGRVDKSYYLNEIVRLADMGKGTVKRELEKLAAVGLLIVFKQGNQIHYQANENNPIFKDLLNIIKKTFGVAGELRAALSNILPEVECAFVYGSVAKGVEHSGSDIDVLFISDDLSYSELMDALSVAETTLGREINPTILNRDELEARLLQNQSFITRVLSQDKLWLKGEAEYFQQFERAG